MKTMDKIAREAMMPDYEMYSVDLKEGNICQLDKHFMHEDKTNTIIILLHVVV